MILLTILDIVGWAPTGLGINLIHFGHCSFIIELVLGKMHFRIVHIKNYTFNVNGVTCFKFLQTAPRHYIFQCNRAISQGPSRQ